MPSVFVYFNSRVRELPGFTSKRYSDDSGDNIHLNGISLRDDKGRLHAMWNDNDPIPEDLLESVDEISWREVIPRMGLRECGIYQHETAECELIEANPDSTGHKKPAYMLNVTARKMEHLQELLRQVKVGTIRPSESYEGEQMGMSQVELEEELRQTRSHSTRVADALRNIGANLRTFRLEFEGRVPFCTKERVMRRIDAILKNHCI